MSNMTIDSNSSTNTDASCDTSNCDPINSAENNSETDTDISRSLEDSDCKSLDGPPKMEVLKFLLPGLCHLSAEEKARAILLEEGLIDLIGDYMMFQWTLFNLGGPDMRSAEVSCFVTPLVHPCLLHSAGVFFQVAMTTMSGVFMNLLILEETVFTDHPVSKLLLNFLLQNLPKFGTYLDSFLMKSCQHVLEWN